MKRKGFTLVELLAVIVVLAIISIITIPIIGNVIDESKKKALEVSANGLVEAASYYTINHDGVYEFVFDENKKGETIKGEQLDYKGSIEGTGKLYIDQEGDISLCLVDDKYYVYKNYNSGIYVGEVKDNSCIIGYDVLTNKYVAMLDDGTGQISNVYSKDEVNNLIDNLQSQISNNSSNINSLQTSIDSINNNLPIYNEETDTLDIYSGGNLIGSIPCGFQKITLYNSGVTPTGITIKNNGTGVTLNNNNISLRGGYSYGGAADGNALFNKLIKMDGKNKITVECNISTVGYDGFLFIGLSKSDNPTFSSLSHLVKFSNNSTGLTTGSKILEMDVSNITGDFYICVGVLASIYNNDALVATISKITVE